MDERVFGLVSGFFFWEFCCFECFEVVYESILSIEFFVFVGLMFVECVLCIFFFFGVN